MNAKAVPPPSASAEEIVPVARAALEEGKAEAVTVLPTREQSGGMFSHIIVATAGGARHAAALAERVVKALKQPGVRAPAVETSEEREWILIDAGDAVIHIMQPQARARYDLESLWRFEPPEKQ